MKKRSSTSDGCVAKLKVVADPTRLAVLEILMQGPKQVGEIAKQLRVEQSLLSHHLKTLRDAKLVESQRQAQAVIYQLAATTTKHVSGKSINLGCCQISF